jgi:hypothetical protein
MTVVVPPHRAVLSDTMRRSVSGLLQACIQQTRMTGAGLHVIDRHGVLRQVVAAGAGAEEFERITVAGMEGPGVEAFVRNHMVASADLVRDGRWSALAAALHGIQIRAACAVPVRVGGTAVGCLSVIRDRPGAWSHEERQSLGRYGVLTELVLRPGSGADGPLVEGLQRAVGERAMIERGIGFLMARQGLTAPQAFAVLGITASREGSAVGDTVTRLLAAAGPEGSARGRVRPSGLAR